MHRFPLCPAGLLAAALLGGCAGAAGTATATPPGTATPTASARPTSSGSGGPNLFAGLNVIVHSHPGSGSEATDATILDYMVSPGCHVFHVQYTYQHQSTPQVEAFDYTVGSTPGDLFSSTGESRSDVTLPPAVPGDASFDHTVVWVHNDYAKLDVVTCTR